MTSETIAAHGTATPSMRISLPGDLWGGLAAMLVALPSSIAFGVVILLLLFRPQGLLRAAGLIS